MRFQLHRKTFGHPDQEPLFIVPGWSMPMESMMPLIDRLSRRYFVVAVDLPGFSMDQDAQKRSSLGPNYDIDALSEQLIEAAPERCWWLGWSLGGAIATYVAARRSSCVKGLITLSSSPCFVERQDWPAGMAESVFDEFAALVEAKPAVGLKRFSALQSSGAQDERNLIRYLTKLSSPVAENRLALIGGLRLLKSLDVRRELELLDVPGLHIYGGKDSLVSQTLLPDLKLNKELQTVVVLDECAHVPFVEQTEVCSKVIEDYLSER